MPHETASLGRNRAQRNPDAELDALVAAELAELQPQLRSEVTRPAAAPTVTVHVEEPIEVELDRLAQRLRGHPDRAALIERLRAASLDEEPAAGEGPAAEVVAEASRPPDPE